MNATGERRAGSPPVILEAKIVADAVRTNAAGRAGPAGMHASPLALSPLMRPCELRNLDLVTYENGLQLQQKLVSMRQADSIPDQLLLLEHPPVITLGRGGNRGNLLASNEALRARRIRFFETERGGDITYHGPGQLVGYPIVHLGEGSRDVRKYVTQLEEVLIRTVAQFGITAVRVDGLRGIWVGDRKIAAVGVRIARWVTSHGFALNVEPDLEHFNLITPCGIPDRGVTSIARECGRSVGVDEIRQVVASTFAEVFGRQLVPMAEAIRLVKVIAHDDHRVLLLHRRPERGNFWQPITGSIEPGELPIDAARRELREETGHSGEPVPMNLSQSFMIDSQFLNARFDQPVIALETGYSARLSSQLPIVIDGEEHDAVDWFTFERAYETIRWTDDREALEQLEATLRAAPPVELQSA